MKHIDAIYAFGKNSVLFQCGVYDDECLQRGSFYFGPAGKNPSVATSYAYVSRLCFRSKATTRLRVSYPTSHESFPWLALLPGAKLLGDALANSRPRITPNRTPASPNVPRLVSIER